MYRFGHHGVVETFFSTTKIFPKEVHLMCINFNVKFVACEFSRALSSFYFAVQVTRDLQSHFFNSKKLSKFALYLSSLELPISWSSLSLKPRPMSPNTLSSLNGVVFDKICTKGLLHKHLHRFLKPLVFLLTYIKKLETWLDSFCMDWLSNKTYEVNINFYDVSTLCITKVWKWENV